MGKPNLQGKNILLAGATGALGRKIAAHLVASGTRVTALVRRGSNNHPVALLQRQGIVLSLETTGSPYQSG